MNYIRNFAIVAHVDHGKSTLSNCIIQICKGIKEDKIKNEVLEIMDLEKERGITIKAQSINLIYFFNKKKYQINFIDTPGHIDFSNEVSRSLLACEGVLLIIDAKKGIQAQTISNVKIAKKMKLPIVVAINKIDLPFLSISNLKNNIKEIIGIKDSPILCSGKTGKGVKNLLKTIINRIPPPVGSNRNSLEAIIIDSWFDNYLGVISIIRIKNGFIKIKQKIKISSTNKVYTIKKIGIFSPNKVEIKKLQSGEIGWIACNIKNIHGAPIGDVIVEESNRKTILSKIRKIKPQIFSCFFPINQKENQKFFDAIKKLSINDSSFSYEMTHSPILGNGIKCGFLGFLHMEIIKERIEREYNIEIIITSPTILYEILGKDGTIFYRNDFSDLIKKNQISEIREPILLCEILTPHKYIGKIINLCSQNRGKQISIFYYEKQVSIVYELPMIEVVVNFSEDLKSVSCGYASFYYNFKCFRKSNIVCLEILINKKKVDALTFTFHKDKSYEKSKDIVSLLQKFIPRQQFGITIQAAIGNKIISRANVKQLRKNVLAKCYGGDITRKKKLLQKQKKGKKKMKKIGNIFIPQEALLVVFKMGRNT
ncbi:translation elongation factor 4 [bacterium endosymbiont of Pedicinus badii]|uniref:translation elongation factor 4 n=1 Tax=bacterium endosymbiont of Pedicinus badii TaxID=1719126 RepID=UPI0009BB1C13|nr:translation elongation factor 4 [bacterium endosymbiont of Pedicinus badii]OQM34497.1 elongation factor 4 [bacterium endosymbiont of Pedicinus badii]